VVFRALNDFYIISLSNRLTFGVSDESYSRNASRPGK